MPQAFSAAMLRGAEKTLLRASGGTKGGVEKKRKTAGGVPPSPFLLGGG